MKTISSQFIYFYEKILKINKINNFHPVRSFCERKKPLLLLFFVRLFLFLLVGFGWFALLFTHNLFKKNNKLAWNCLDSLIYCTTDVYPYQPAYWEFICSHLFFFFDNLWESLLFMRIFFICDFLSLYENKLVYEYHYLKQIFCH